MRKLPDYIAVIFSQTVLASGLFIVWYLLLGLWSPKLGAFVGAIAGFVLITYLKMAERGKGM